MSMAMVATPTVMSATARLIMNIFETWGQSWESMRIMRKYDIGEHSDDYGADVESTVTSVDYN